MISWKLTLETMKQEKNNQTMTDIMQYITGEHLGMVYAC